MIAMQYATAGERHYARKLVRNLLSRGHYLSVCDGEEWTVNRSRKEEEILGALCTTGIDEIIASDPAGTRLGWFCLVWGNDADGSELIADHSANTLCETVWSEVTGEQVA